MSSVSDLQSLLQKIDDIEIPKNLLSENNTTNNNKENHSGTGSGSTPNDNNKSSSASLVEQYKTVRDEYLRRRVQRAVLEHVQTFDGKTFAKIDVPSKEDIEGLENERVSKLREVQEKAELIEKLQIDIQAKHNVLQSRRDYYREMLIQLESNTSSDVNGADDDDDVMIDIDEEEYERQKEKLRAIQQRRAELELKLQTIKHENMELERSVREKNADIRKMQQNSTRPDESCDYDSLNNIEALEKEKELSKNLDDNISQLVEAKDMYDKLRGIVEELSGIRFVSITPTITATTNNEPMVYITLELLKKHEIELCIQQASSSATLDGDNKVTESSKTSNYRNNVKVISARILTNPTIEGPADVVDVDDENKSFDSTAAVPPVQLDVPDLNDLVQIAATRNTQLWPLCVSEDENDVAFVVREALARFSMIEKRVELLSTLQRMAVTSIGKIYPLLNDDSNSNTNRNYSVDQEVVCSLEDEQITVLLRLTPDCPFVPGSAYIDEIAGYGGWEQDELDKIRDEINNMQMTSPVSIIQELKNIIQTLQETNGLRLPKTPSIPTKDNIFFITSKQQQT